MLVFTKVAYVFGSVNAHPDAVSSSFSHRPSALSFPSLPRYAMLHLAMDAAKPPIIGFAQQALPAQKVGELHKKGEGR